MRKLRTSVSYKKEILSAPLQRNDGKPITITDLKKFYKQYGTIIIDSGIPKVLIGTRTLLMEDVILG